MWVGNGCFASNDKKSRQHCNDWHHFAFLIINQSCKQAFGTLVIFQPHKSEKLPQVGAQLPWTSWHELPGSSVFGKPDNETIICVILRCCLWLKLYDWVLGVVYINWHELLWYLFSPNSKMSVALGRVKKQNMQSCRNKH